MIRRKPLVRGSRSGRRPATLKRVSAKRRRAKLGTKDDPVYQAVDRRSRGWCEVTHAGCANLASEHHHLFKPRASYHRPEFILHVCKAAHLEFEPRPFAKGRRVPWWFSEFFQRYETIVVTAPNKTIARERMAALGCVLRKPDVRGPGPQAPRPRAARAHGA